MSRVPVRLEPPSHPPTADDESSGGGGRDWVELFRAANDIEAALLVGKLADESIETRAIKDRSGPSQWLYGGSNPWAPVLVYVRRSQLVDARILLAEISLAADDDPAQPDEPDGSKIPRMWWATALALGLALSAMAVHQVADQVRFCQLPILCESGDTP
ncbi:MAG: DUF2007 domain-containing protein [Actinomycetota bacterium]